jgi:hypothetical protein
MPRSDTATILILSESIATSVPNVAPSEIPGLIKVALILVPFGRCKTARPVETGQARDGDARAGHLKPA